MIDLAALLQTASLGDKRLDQRALTLVGDIIKGQASATHGPEGVGHQRTWAHAMGTFRFFDNDRLTLPALYEPCRVALRQLVSQGQRCYVVHDVSVVDFTAHQRKEDLEQVGNERGYGYELFTSLVLSAQGNPLGPLMQEMRTIKGLLSSESPTSLPFVDHLSQMERAVVATDRTLPGRDAVHICDREFDDLQLQRFIQHKARRYLIRAQHLARKVLWEGRRMTLKQAAQQVPLKQAGQVVRKGQAYDLWVGQTEVVFDGKSLRGVAKKRQMPRRGVPISVRIVISELRSLGQTPLRWVLLTNLEDELLDVVSAYVWRWRVEISHSWCSPFDSLLCSWDARPRSSVPAALGSLAKGAEPREFLGIGIDDPTAVRLVELASLQPTPLQP